VVFFGRPSWVAAAATVAALLLSMPLSAQARERDVPGNSPLPAAVSPAHIHLNDTVLTGAVASAAGPSRPTRAYSTADGQSVSVRVSRAYPDDVAADRALVDFLDSRLHGPELGSLSVYVGAPSEIERLCGGAGAVACYGVAEQRMYVPGEAVHGVPVEYALTHEYGHHVASWRSNRPWNALDWGAKYWSSAMRVCAGVEAGRLFPGNQGRHYLSDPGEGFADGYAHVHYPDVAWQYNPILRPDRAAFAAIRRDVLHPWAGPRSRTVRGRLGQGRGVRRFHIRMRLDGAIRLKLAAPAHMRAELTVRGAGSAAGRTVRGGRGFGVEWCRQRPAELVTVTVRRRSGAGPFRLRVSWPG
jgi:hypothetical protein